MFQQEIEIQNSRPTYTQNGKGSIKEKVGPWESIKDALNECNELMTSTALSGQTIKLDYVSADIFHGFKVRDRYPQ